MPILVNTTRAPRFLVYRISGPLPPAEQQSRLRDTLIAHGLLTADTVAVMDARELAQAPEGEVPAETLFTMLHRDDWARRRAYLFHPDMRRHMIQQFQDLAITTVASAAFEDEEEAVRWLMGYAAGGGIAPRHNL